MRVLFFLFLFGLGSVLVGCSPADEKTLAARAEKAYAEKQYAKAIAGYEALLRLTGERAVLYRNLALAAYGAKDTSTARKAAEHALRLSGNAPEADGCRELLGMIAEEEKQPETAFQWYRQVLNSRDIALRVRVSSRLAQLYRAQGRVDGALGMLLSAWYDAPQDATTVFNLGMLSVKEPLLLRQAALDFFTLAEHLLPKGAPQVREAQTWRTRLEKNLARLQQVPAAVGDASACAKAIKAAKEKQARRQWRDAEALFAKATKADPSNFDAALETGRMAAKNNHKETALKAYAAAIALRENAQDARIEAAQLAYDAKRYELALSYLRPAMVTQRRNRFLADLYMRILTAQRKLPEARVFGEYYLKLYGQAPESYRKWVNSLPEM